MRIGENDINHLLRQTKHCPPAATAEQQAILGQQAERDQKKGEQKRKKAERELHGLLEHQREQERVQMRKRELGLSTPVDEVCEGSLVFCWFFSEKIVCDSFQTTNLCTIEQILLDILQEVTQGLRDGKRVRCFLVCYI